MNAFSSSMRRMPAISGLALLWWGMASAALSLGALFACHGDTCTASQFDRDLLSALHAWQQPWLTGFMKAVTWFGSIAILLPIALALAWCYWRDGNHSAAMLLPLSIGGAWLLAHVIKPLVARPRPDLYPPLVDMPLDLSFPSAHAMQVTALALAWILAPRLRPAVATITAVVLLVTLVGVSRLYLQVHFPSDVLAGIIAGVGWVAGLRLILSKRA